MENADNDTSQGKHEVEQILHAKVVAAEAFAEKAQVPLATLIAKVLQSSPLKPNTNVTAAFCRYATNQGYGEKIDELFDFHSEYVNPNELCVSHTHYDAISQKVPLPCQLLRLALSCAPYKTDKVEERTRPQASGTITMEPLLGSEIVFMSCNDRLRIHFGFVFLISCGCV